MMKIRLSLEKWSRSTTKMHCAEKTSSAKITARGEHYSMAKREKPYNFVSAGIPLLPKENQQVDPDRKCPWPPKRFRNSHEKSRGNNLPEGQNERGQRGFRSNRHGKP